MLALDDTQRLYISILVLVIRRCTQIIVHRFGVTVTGLFVFDRVTTKRVAVLCDKLQFFSLLGAVHLLDLIKCHPLSLEDLVPVLGVILLRIWIDQNIQRIFRSDTNLTLNVIAKVHADIKVPAPIHDQTVRKHLLLDPVELVVVSNLHVQLVQGLRDLFIPATARLELDVCTAGGLLAQYRVDCRQNCIDSQRRSAFCIKHRHVCLIPLLTLVERIALFSHVYVFKVPVIPSTDIAVVLSTRYLHLLGGSQ